MPAERNYKSSIKTLVQNVLRWFHRPNDAGYNQENPARKNAQIPAKLSTKLSTKLKRIKLSSTSKSPTKLYALDTQHATKRKQANRRLMGRWRVNLYKIWPSPPRGCPPLGEGVVGGGRARTPSEGGGFRALCEPGNTNTIPTALRRKITDLSIRLSWGDLRMHIREI